MIKYLQHLEIFPENISLYKKAFTHKSYANEKELESNERLEFLGDAVLELVVTNFLYKKFPKLPEGKLTAFRSALVRKESLANTAKIINLGSQILLSKGEKRSKGEKKDYILANTVEAILGAIFLDLGMQEATLFVERYLLISLDDIVEGKKHIGPKTAFQEYAQAEKMGTPTYELISEEGPDHKKNFVMGAYLENKLIEKGEGNSKQKAESEAAKNALTLLLQTNEKNR
jgi:ribonuclease-3